MINTSIFGSELKKMGFEFYSGIPCSYLKELINMVGSMGCISSLGLGLALTRKEKAVIAIDGDGALLMRMGALRSQREIAVVLDD